ncbi:MAG TPA: GlsB/YeaQ/YmgE family stress response membrane protein, partial [Saprospiraceae bacterium]|nr:GlsB/YeaQ/YmgE family stress response membrane protein [Saprospiraceae bacterium]
FHPCFSFSTYKTTSMGILYYLIVGATAGWLGGKIMHGSGFGPVGNIIVGIVGGIIGGWLFGLLGITTSGGLIGSIITAVAGAVALLWVAGMLKK